jgi:hypothetical protein
LRKFLRKLNFNKRKTIENWDNDVSTFSNFEQDIENSLDDPIKKMEKAFW